MNLHQLHIFETQFEACDFQKTHVCSNCWRMLVNRKEGEGWICECTECKELTRGYVTRKYVDRRIEQSIQFAREARRALAPYVPFLQTEKRTEAQNLIDLGF